MSKKDSAHSVIINIPRPRTVIKKSASDIKKPITNKICYKTKNFRKPSDTTLQVFSLPENKPIQISVLKHDDLLLAYRLYANKQDISNHKRRLGTKLHEKYKVINTDLRHRLHVQDPPNDVYAVTDIDDGYFRYLNDHPPTQYIPLYKSLKFEYHERLRMRQEIGYRKDCVLYIEDSYRSELQKYELSVNKYMFQVKKFDQFIAEDYQKSMAILKNCEALIDKLNTKVSLRKNLANKLFLIQSKLIGLDYMYFVQQKYGRFLYYLSPPSWRAKHREFAHSVEIEAKGFDLGFSSEEDTFNVIFQNMQNECYRGLIKSVLYFSCPDDLMTLFESIEKQLLHHFVRVTPLAPRGSKLKKDLIVLKNDIEQDTALVAHLIEEFAKLVDFCEEREVQLQTKFMRILYGLFYDTVAATDVLKLQMHLEFCYEKVFAEKQINMELVSTAKALEKLYFDYIFKLDIFTNEKIKLAMKQCFEKGKIKTKKAMMASRELHLFDRLKNSLLEAYGERKSHDIASPLRAVKVPSFCKLKRSSKSAVRNSSQRLLTEFEIEYLCLFTDWTEKEDPAKYLQCLTVTGSDC